jgi:glycosyltransferase involved in cell wall biosynthesis
MLVSAVVSPELRAEVRSAIRPTPEYLRLEAGYGVELLDWSKAGLGPGHRSALRSARHVAAALRHVDEFDVIFSDGEHVGIPLALAERTRRGRVRHVMLGHNLLTPKKTALLRYSGAGRRIDRIVVHSSNQFAGIASRTHLPATKLAVVPYGIDTSFWRPQADVEHEGLVVTAGREHRDYRTLASAIMPNTRVVIADHSPFTPHATRQDPDAWPANIERVALDPVGLRSLYSQAAVVVVPVVDSPMPAGITTLLEAMAMGKAVVVTETAALRGVVEDGITGLTVKPGDTSGLRRAIEALLESPAARGSLGARAREVAIERYDVDVFAKALVQNLSDVVPE